jgi:collagen triple helix repeat protein
MIRNGISSLSRLSLFVPLAFSACGEGNVADGARNAEQDGTPSLAIATFEYKSALPACSKTNQSQVYYVSSEEQLYFCDGKKLLPLDLDCDPSWLTDTIAAKTSVCPAGGTVIRSGADQNENHVLDKWEIQSTSTVCNGKDGKNGLNGKDGKNGVNGKDGAVGAAGPEGPAGADGQDGADGGNGTSCTVHDNGDGSALVTCDDGTTANLYGPTGASGPQGPAGADGQDGQDGATGPQGPAGANGQDGATGPRGPAGADGSSCTVLDNGDHSYDIICPDGSHATVHDGQDGQDAPVGTVLLNIVPEPKSDNCHAGGNLIQIGIDTDGSTLLESDEVTGSEYACAPLITIESLVISSDAELEQLRGVREIRSSLQITGAVTNDALSQAGVDLERVESLRVYGTTNLTSLPFDQLESVSYLELGDNAALTSFSLDQLSSLVTLNAYNNYALTSFSLDQPSSLAILYLNNNTALTSFSFDQLSTVTNWVYIVNSDALTSLSGLDALTNVTVEYSILANASLPTCEAQRILNNLISTPPSVNIVGNDDTGVCP